MSKKWEEKLMTLTDNPTSKTDLIAVGKNSKEHGFSARKFVVRHWYAARNMGRNVAIIEDATIPMTKAMDMANILTRFTRARQHEERHEHIENVEQEIANQLRDHDPREATRILLQKYDLKPKQQTNGSASNVTRAA